MNEITIITPENIDQFKFVGQWRIEGTMKPDGDSSQSKAFTLNFTVNAGARAVMTSSLNDKKVRWTNGKSGRAKFNSHRNAAVIEVDYASPAKLVLSRQDKIDDYITKGYSPEAAVIAVDNPVEFAQIVSEYMKSRS